MVVVQRLHELGYRDNAWGTDRPIEVVDGTFEAIKTFDGVAVAITWCDKIEVEVYTYEGEPDKHRRVGVPDNPEAYIEDIKDLIKEDV